jgi:hypothetical protein
MAVFFLNDETKNLFNEEKTALYRVLSIDRLIELLEKDKWAFVSPTLWSDPYEKAFIEAEYHHNGENFSIPIKPTKVGDQVQYSLFCMCWTETRESDAFWKTYTPNSDGVKIAIWAKDMINAFSKIKDYDVYIGKASYEDYRTLYSFKDDSKFWKRLKSNIINETHLGLMLKKRIPFSYEKEVRILLVRKSPMERNIAKILIPDSASLIHSFKFDPRMGSYMFRVLKSIMINKFQIRENIIRQSRLYKKPSGNISFKNEL